MRTTLSFKDPLKYNTFKSNFVRPNYSKIFFHYLNNYRYSHPFPHHQDEDACRQLDLPLIFKLQYSFNSKEMVVKPRLIVSTWPWPGTWQVNLLQKWVFSACSFLFPTTMGDLYYLSYLNAAKNPFSFCKCPFLPGSWSGGRGWHPHFLYWGWIFWVLSSAWSHSLCSAHLLPVAGEMRFGLSLRWRSWWASGLIVGLQMV